jgi:hypothetical protein
MSYRQWRLRIDPAMPLNMVEQYLGIDRQALVKGIAAGRLPVHTFRSADGRTFRMVRLVHVYRFGRGLRRDEMRPAAFEPAGAGAGAALRQAA